VEIQQQENRDPDEEAGVTSSRRGEGGLADALERAGCRAAGTACKSEAEVVVVLSRA